MSSFLLNCLYTLVLGNTSTSKTSLSGSCIGFAGKKKRSFQLFYRCRERLADIQENKPLQTLRV